MVVPMFVSHRDDCSNEVLMYAILDMQSSTHSYLRVYARNYMLPVRKLSSYCLQCQPRKKCHSVNVGRAYNDSIDVASNEAYTRSSIPMNRSHISSADATRKLSHRATYASKIPPVLDCDIGLLIGYDCPRALKQRHVSPGWRGSVCNQDLSWLEHSWHNG